MLKTLYAAALFVFLGCSSPLPPPDASYVIQGTITELPSPDDRSKQLLIHHEAIPNFTDETGKVVGMHQMTMPFTVAKPEFLIGFHVGDKVEFNLEVRWNQHPFDQIVSIKKK